MEFVAQLRRDSVINYLRLDYVVQLANFAEMAGLVELGKRFAADRIYFSKAANWGTWSSEKFRELSVWEPDHPQYDAFARTIVQPLFDDDRVLMGNLSRDRAVAIERMTRERPTVKRPQRARSDPWVQDQP